MDTKHRRDVTFTLGTLNDATSVAVATTEEGRAWFSEHAGDAANEVEVVKGDARALAARMATDGLRVG